MGPSTSGWLGFGPVARMSPWKHGRPHPDILESWLASGMVDIAVTFRADFKGIRQPEMLFQDRLILVSRKPKAYQPGDPTYIFVDWGEEFAATTP